MNKLENIGVSASLKEETIKLNLEEYTEGDAEFLIEFTQNILENMLYLRSEVSSGLEKRSADELADLTHMVKPTLEILGQDEILAGLGQLRLGALENGTWLETSITKTIEILQNILEHAECTLATH